MRCQSLLVKWLCGLLIWFGAIPVYAQTLPTPRLTNVFPPGGQVGSTFEVTITGSDLNDAQGLHFSFPGAKVEVLTAAAVKVDPKAKQPGMKTGPLTAQKFKVTLPTNIPLGVHDVRIVTERGVSNPRAFAIGDLKEVVEQEPNDDVAKAQVLELNSTASGVISNPTDVDYFAFKGKKGQRVVASCLTTSIDSKLPALVQIFSLNDGKELASGRGYRGEDALADCELPADGDYYARVSGFTHTLGGPDYFYRLTVSTGPWIDAVFPATIPPGQDAKVTVLGRNLPGGVIDPSQVVDGRPLEKMTMTVKAPGEERENQRLRFPGLVWPAASVLDGFPIYVTNPTGSSMPFLLTYARAPVVIDAGDNDTPETAQKITIPCEISGRIEKKNDRDWYQFTAKKGQVYSLEVFGERLGSPVDLYFLLQNAKGQTITEQDDNNDVLAPQFFTRSDDPARYRFTVPADGDYFLLIANREAFTQFGPRHYYLARIAPEQPDFQIVAMPLNPQQPDSVVIGQEGNQAFQLIVWRLGGFTGDIALSAENLPPGLAVKPQIIAASQKQGMVVISADQDAAPWVGGLTLLGTATINGAKVTREIRSATITWPVPQPNIPTVSRLDRELVLAIRGKAPYTLSVDKDQWSISPGNKITIPVKLTPRDDKFKSNVIVAPLNLPAGMTAQPVTLAAGKETANLILEHKGMIAPGPFTLILRGQTQPPNPKQPQPPKAGGPINLIQHAPPIQLIIEAKTKTPSSSGNTKKAGESETKFIVRADANLENNIPMSAHYNGLHVFREGKKKATFAR